MRERERKRREERGKGRAERGKGGQEMRREKEEKGRKFAKLTVSHSIDTASKEREMNTGLECEKRQKALKKIPHIREISILPEI